MTDKTPSRKRRATDANIGVEEHNDTQPGSCIALLKSDRRRMRDAYWAVHGSIEELAAYFQETVAPRDGTSRDVIEVLTESAIKDVAFLQRSLDYFARIVRSLQVVYASLYGDADAREQEIGQLYLTLQDVRNTVERAYVCVHTKRVKEQQQTLVGDATNALDLCRAIGAGAHATFTSFMRDDEMARSATSGSNNEMARSATSGSESDSYDSDYVPDEDDAAEAAEAAAFISSDDETTGDAMLARLVHATSEAFGASARITTTAIVDADAAESDGADPTS